MATKKEIYLKHRVKVFMVFRAWKQAGGGVVELRDLVRATGMAYSTVKVIARRLRVPLDPSGRSKSMNCRLAVDVAMKLNSEGYGYRLLGREG